MATPAAGPAAARPSRPRLVFFHSRASGRCRRVEGYIAQVLQRRSNHHTFSFESVEISDHPDLKAHFAIDAVPTLVVIEDKLVRGRLQEPRGCREIERFLAPWLR